MKIKNIKIDAFRSIKAINNIELNDFNIFVGQNNHGKTNIFEAIDWLFTGSGEIEEICYMRKTVDFEISVEVEFIGLQAALSGFKNAKQKKALEDIFEKEDLIRIKRSSGYEKGEDLQLFNPKKNVWENPLGRDTAYRQILPTLEYISTKKFLEDVAKYGKTTPISKMLSGVLEKFLEVDPEYGKFKSSFDELFGDPDDPDQKTQIRQKIDDIGGTVGTFLQKQFPDTRSVKFKVGNPELEDLFKKFKTTVDDGIENDSSEKGDGMQRALMLAIIETYANFRKNNGEAGNFIFMIDEAELHLHPTAQRALKNALLEISQSGDQVLVNTHSSVMVADDHGLQNIFRVEKKNGETSIFLIASSSQKQEIIYELLGGSPGDLLLPNNFLIVEGHSELKFLSIIINRFYAENPNIQIIFASGDLEQQEKSMNSINKLYNLLNARPVYADKTVILCDKPASKEKEDDLIKFKNGYPDLEKDSRIHILPVSNLEEYYPKKWRKTTEEAQQLARERKKVDLAEECAKNITKDEFENDMKEILNALEVCWKLAFK